MRTRLLISCGLTLLMISLFISCSKAGSDTPVSAPPPADSTTTLPPRDTTTAPSKDTTTSIPPKDTSATPPKDTLGLVVYKTIVANASQINFVQTGEYFIKYSNSGGYVVQMNSYQGTDATLSSNNPGSITVSIDPNTGNQLLTSSRFTDKAPNDDALVSDTSKFYYLMLMSHDTTTLIFPSKPIVYQNFPSAITVDDEKAINNRNVQIEKLIVK